MYVYSRIFNVTPDKIDFKLSPIPRLEVETVADFMILFEIGVLTPDMSLELSQVLLGQAAKPYAKVMQGEKGNGRDKEGQETKEIKEANGGAVDDSILTKRQRH